VTEESEAIVGAWRCRSSHIPVNRVLDTKTIIRKMEGKRHKGSLTPKNIFANTNYRKII
jgi:hypothetical protein